MNENKYNTTQHVDGQPYPTRPWLHAILSLANGNRCMMRARHQNHATVFLAHSTTDHNHTSRTPAPSPSTSPYRLDTIISQYPRSDLTTSTMNLTVRHQFSCEDTFNKHLQHIPAALTAQPPQIRNLRVPNHV
jgi:hypothetical protein